MIVRKAELVKYLKCINDPRYQFLTMIQYLGEIGALKSISDIKNLSIPKYLKIANPGNRKIQSNARLLNTEEFSLEILTGLI